jgi:hypothetical protein
MKSNKKPVAVKKPMKKTADKMHMMPGGKMMANSKMKKGKC